MKTYLFSYNFDGSKWGFEIVAKDRDEARRRLAAMQFSSLDGILLASIPASPKGVLGRFLSLIGYRLVKAQAAPND